MTVVVDASVVVAALVDGGPEGAWAARVLAAPLVAPELMPFECANVLRRLAATGRLGDDLATQAATDVLLLGVELWPYAPLAEHAWSLRGELTIYDASYVALAAELDAPLATLDAKLVRAGARKCQFLTPGSEPLL
ncbi:MAG: hypothetical protein QOG99_900 [Frankiales bacterium]|nr:hypothetical protein [Frankiales bacterium]